MFIRSVSYEIKPGMMEEAEQLYHTLTRKAIDTHKGFERGYAMVNSKTGMAVTVAVWASKEAFEEFNGTDAGKELAERVTPLLANPPVVTEFDRLIQP
jgi:quinol monooxygenase YgiN